MRVVSRADFLKLPPGTIYAKGKPWYFENISIKADSLPNDFVCLGLAWVDAHDSGEASYRLEEMLKAGASYPLDKVYGRDGCFDDDDIFLVYERDDLAWIRDQIDAAMKL